MESTSEDGAPAVSLACTVRGCGAVLRRAMEAGRQRGPWRCPRGHSFDVARSGYVSLLQPQDRRSPRAGDPRSAVEARGRLSALALLEPLAQAIERAIAGPGRRGPTTLLDVGCGDGWMVARLLRELPPGSAAVGLDLSARAAERAARSHPYATWIVANADRGLPFPDGSFDWALTVTGPKPAPELARVLRRRGRLAVAVPAPDDLAELRAELLGRAAEVDRAPAAREHFAPWFALESSRRVSVRRRFEGEVLRDLLAGSYRAGRRSEQERASELGPLEVTLSWDLLILARAASP